MLIPLEIAWREISQDKEQEKHRCIRQSKDKGKFGFGNKGSVGYYLAVSELMGHGFVLLNLVIPEV
jgi:hypothetical protein